MFLSEAVPSLEEREVLRSEIVESVLQKWSLSISMALVQHPPYPRDSVKVVVRYI